MGFTPVDENTVKDDEGNTYYFPMGGSQSPVNQNTPDFNGAPLTETPLRTILPSSAEATLTDSGLPPDQLQGPPDPGSETQVQRFVTHPKPSLAEARNQVLTSDPVGFASTGGQVKTDEDLVRAAGGHALHEEETAKAKAEQARILQGGEIAKNKEMARQTLQTADDYDTHVQALMADANNRWNDWKKRSDTAAKQLVDPKHAFTNMSTLSRVGWMLDFLGAGMSGSNAVNQVSEQLNKLVEQDISAQKFTIQNKREALESEKTMLSEKDRLGKDALTDWYFAKNLRMEAVGKQLDAKISEMGLPAAQKAGLLAARDVIEKGVLDVQEKVNTHYQEQAKQKATFSHAEYMARLESSLRLTEDAFKANLKKGEDKNDSLPTGTPLGLQMVDKSTGKAVPGGKIPLKVKGDKAVEAGKLFDQANEEASQLKEVQVDLENMSTSDLMRGGTPEFKAKVKDLIQTRAVRDNGHRLSDADVDRAAQEEFGVMMKDSLGANFADSARLVGSYKEGVQRTINYQLRNLSTKTVNKLQPYIDSDAAQKFDIKFNINDTHVTKPSDTPDDLNTALTKASQGAPVSDLKAAGPRSPVSVDLKTPYETQVYELEKTKGRGNEGGLPRLQPQEEAKVDEAASAFTKATPDDILKLSQAYLRNTNLSIEAKHEIRLEAMEALTDAIARQDAVNSEAENAYNRNAIPRGAYKGEFTPTSSRDAQGNPTDEFKAYMDSDLVNEMRRKAGLEPRQR